MVDLDDFWLVSAPLRFAPFRSDQPKIAQIHHPQTSIKPARVERLRSQTLRAGQTPKDPAKPEKIRLRWAKQQRSL